MESKLIEIYKKEVFLHIGSMKAHTNIVIKDSNIINSLIEKVDNLLLKEY